MAKKAKQKSRSARWADAVGDARVEFDKLQEQASELSNALGRLLDVQSEYSDWHDNLPDSGGSDATREKLEAIVELDIESVMDNPLENWGDVERLIDEAEGMEPPVGYGRD